MTTRQELQNKFNESNQKYRVDSAERKLKALKYELQKREIDSELKNIDDEQLKADIAKMEFEKQLSEEVNRLPPEPAPVGSQAGPQDGTGPNKCAEKKE